MKLNKQQIQERTDSKKKKKEIKEMIRRRELYWDIHDLMVSMEFYLCVRKVGLGTLKEFHGNFKRMSKWFQEGPEMSREDINFITARKSPCVTYDRELP